jgi:outer membrane protein assembly factor BamA
MKYAPSYFLLLALLFTGSNALCQWRITSDDERQNKQLSASFPNKAQAMQAVQHYYSELIAQGYLDASIDTLVVDSIIRLNVVKGTPYTLRSIQWQEDSLHRAPENNVSYRKARPLETSLIEYQMSKVLSHYENHGYPFASIHVLQLNEEAGKTDLKLRLQRGSLIVLDSLIIRSDDRLPVKYITKYLDLRKGDYYNESKMQALDKKLREIPFVQLSGPTELRFKPGEADVYLFLKRKKASYFNGIVGVRPDDVTGKINITGDAEIKLVNAFNSGEELYLNWRKLQSQTQDLTIKTTLPYLFSSPIGVDGMLKIYKRDSTFTSLKANGGLVFVFSGTNHIKAFVERNTTNQLSTFFTGLPLANVNATLYGLSGHLEKLDYRFNPRKGYQATAQLSTGSRTVNKRQQDEQEAHHNGRYNLYRIEADGELYIPTWKRQTIRMGVQGSAFLTDAIYDNEMYRIGGLRTLRGVDEESLYATSYAVGSIEYRFLFEENASLYAFFDQAWYEKKGIGEFITDTPIGFGAGVNFETNAGIFTFNYALGQQFDNPMRVRNAKVSFGFRSIF